MFGVTVKFDVAEFELSVLRIVVCVETPALAVGFEVTPVPTPPVMEKSVTWNGQFMFACLLWVMEDLSFSTSPEKIYIIIEIYI